MHKKTVKKDCIFANIEQNKKHINNQIFFQKRKGALIRGNTVRHKMWAGTQRERTWWFGGDL